MSETTILTQEQYDDLQDYAKGAFIKDGESYIPAKNAILKSTLEDVDGKYKTTAKELEELRGKLSAIEKEKLDAIEQAKINALEDAKNKGDKSDAIELYEQQLQDLRDRNELEKTELKTQLEKLQGSIHSEKKAKILADLRSEIGINKYAKSFNRLVGDRISIDIETGKPVFLNEDGSATSLDLNGFKDELLKDEELEPYVKAAVVTSGGGKANGSNQTGALITTDQKLEEAKKSGNVNDFLKISLNKKG